MTARFRVPEDALDRMRGLIDIPYLEEKLHTKIALHAGENMDAFGYAMMWTLAIADAAEAINGGMSVLAVLEIASYPYAERLIDDEEALGEVRDLFETMGLYHPKGA